MQINGCIDYSGSSTTKVFDIAASWTVSSGGSQVASGGGNSRGLNLQASGTTCPTEFLANVSGLSPSTEYLVSYTGGVPGNIVSGSRMITTSNSPTTTTTLSVNGKKSNITTTTTSDNEELNSGTSRVNAKTSTTTIEAVEDDGQSDDDFADIGVSSKAGKFDMRISSSFSDTEMLLRAVKKGSKSITWNLVTNSGGNYRIITSRSLKGFTLSLWIDGDKWDSLVVR
jgi:hypothetical protein